MQPPHAFPGAVPKDLTGFWEAFTRFINARSSQEEYWSALLQALLLAANGSYGTVLGRNRDGELTVWANAGGMPLVSRLLWRHVVQRAVDGGEPVWVADTSWLAVELGVEDPLAAGLLVLPVPATTEEGPGVLGVVSIECRTGTDLTADIPQLAGLARFAWDGLAFNARLLRWQHRFENLLDQVKRLELLLTADQMQQRKAVVDEDSGLVNLRFFEYFCPIVVAMAHRYELPLTLIMLDVRPTTALAPDLQQEVNRMLGEQLILQCRSCDTIAHLSERVFAVLLPHTDRQGAEILADRIRERVRSVNEHLPAIQLQPRIGLAQLAKGGSAKDLVQAARAACSSDR